MKTTIYDVAEKAGVSISTVSKVMNDQQVGKKSKQKVLKVMQELNYRPSVLASALTGKRTSTIGLLLPDLANPFVAEMARRVEDRAHEFGFSLVICSTDLNPEKEERSVSLLRQKSVDGFILASAFNNRRVIADLVGDNIPVLLLSESHPQFAVNSINIDNVVGGYQVASHLVSLGHTRIAVIGEDATSSQQRINGYKQAFQESGLTVHEDLIAISDSSVEHAQRLTKELLNHPKKPTAIIACNDVLAIGAILAAREIGLDIPKDLSITGFDNTLLSKSCDPPLTTVEQGLDKMCAQAVDLLIEEIEGKSTSKQRILVLPQLVIRKSTAFCQS
ncbi:LacI family DNA-binding transcriptional regulator [Ectobacillus funiculus]|uniref:LacI family DNA-binding transcriptional regulator n=1 Tax=Ectobacillus funiculus TaxID=137993 RepID=UPI00101C461D|nr:LacI family DNA-binding transcriptional regulator [Ectobacillus funiculus]